MDTLSRKRSFWITALSGVVINMVAATVSTADETNSAQAATPRLRILTTAEAWQQLPAAANGHGQPLPTWARVLATELPRTTAALLELDFAQRRNSPVEPRLAAAMRWVSAHALRCDDAERGAAADAVRANIDPSKLEALGKPGFPGWAEADQAALTFAYKMTVDSDSVTDDEFAALVKQFGEKQAASMVLMMAYTNFHDRLILCLSTAQESETPLPPVNVTFPGDAFVINTTPPPSSKKALLPKPTRGDLIERDSDWTTVTYDELQNRLEAQRRKLTRLPIPAWDDVARNLPDGLMKKPSNIVWYRIVFGYAPELAVPFERFMRTAGAEANSKWDRIFGQSLFWVTTRAVKCSYCMGHCEMNWEVAGLTRDEIAERSRLLASDDWSSFTPEEQHAFAFARTLTNQPWKISNDDATRLINGFGTDRAIIVMLNACRYHYMTRISNGFQLTLERENVFYDYYNVTSPAQAGDPPLGEPAVSLPNDDDCWKRMPVATAGAGQPLPAWARAISLQLPRTAAAMLQLDFAHRTQSPLAPILRAKMRWVVAHANHCGYSKAYALSDLERAGADAATRATLIGDPAEWPESDREPLEFARLLTVAAPTIRDDLFESLRRRFGEKHVAAMVLLAAYGNFQDRILLGLNLPLEANGPLPPLEITFSEGAFQMAPLFPAQSQIAALGKSDTTVATSDAEWSRVSYDELQSRLEKQRHRKPRLPIPTWEEVQKNLPPVMATKPTRIVWNLVCSGYVPELAVPWSIATRTMWAETKPDRVFEESLFWIQTRSIECNYCMGHCEMLLEVAGLDKQAVADRTRRLAGPDWSAFPPAEQRAYAYARKLSQTPWTVNVADYRTLETDLGPDVGMATFWWLCRGLYMTRVSDGFQLPLEQENVFQTPPTTPSDDKQPLPESKSQ